MKKIAKLLVFALPSLFLVGCGEGAQSSVSSNTSASSLTPASSKVETSSNKESDKATSSESSNNVSSVKEESSSSTQSVDYEVTEAEWDAAFANLKNFTIVGTMNSGSSAQVSTLEFTDQNVYRMVSSMTKQDSDGNETTQQYESIMSKEGEKWFAYDYDEKNDQWLKEESQTFDTLAFSQSMLLASYGGEFEKFAFDSTNSFYFAESVIKAGQTLKNVKITFKNKALVTINFDVTVQIDAAGSTMDAHYLVHEFGTTEIAIPDESKIHVHTYSNEWTYDSDEHWHRSTCGHSSTKDRGNHEFGSDGVCTVCGYDRNPETDK